MRLIPIKHCTPGMKLGKSIYNEEGLVLLNENVELTSSLISRLERLGIDFLYVHDPRTDDIVIPNLISDETRRKATSAIRANFRRMMENCGRRRTVNVDFIGSTFRDVMTMMIDDLSRNDKAMVMLTSINATDLYLYQHSLNVCIYATTLGLAYGYSKDELMTLGLGALLHDIGKTQVPLELLKKPGQLTAEEFEEMKKHTEHGFKLLKDEPNIPLLAAHCAFQHHERLDGSGYPRGIKEDDIHEYAKWIAIIDSYDAMTTHRTYRPAMLPHQAIEALYAGSGTLYDQSKLEMFRDKVAIYPIGVTVTLQSGEVGIVVDVNARSPQRPIVRVLQDADGRDLKEPYEIDLSKKLNVMIAGVNDVNLPCLEFSR